MKRHVKRDLTVEDLNSGDTILIPRMLDATSKL